MKKNIELKAQSTDHELLRVLARQLGARYVKTMIQLDTYFDSKRGRLKLRQIDDGMEKLIYYIRPNEVNSRKSSFLICDVSGCRELKQFMQIVLGVKVIVEKKRELWLYKQTRIHLDTVKKLGKFVELETNAINRSIEDAQIEHDKVKRALHIDDKDLIAVSYSDLILKA